MSMRPQVSPGRPARAAQTTEVDQPVVGRTAVSTTCVLSLSTPVLPHRRRHTEPWPPGASTTEYTDRGADGDAVASVSTTVPPAPSPPVQSAPPAVAVADATPSRAR